MIKVKDEYNEWIVNNKMMRIEGAIDFAKWLSKNNNISPNGLSTSIKKWKEQLK